MLIDLSVVIPCYNEEEGIPALSETVDRLGTLIAERGLSWELLLINDGSRDGTAEALQRHFGPKVNARVLTHLKNRGVGAAMRTGFEAARGEIVTCYDADCAYPVEDLLRLYELVRAGADVATATPFIEGGSAEGIPLHRRVLSQGVSSLYRGVLGGPAATIQTFSCAFRAYRRDILRSIAFESDGFPAASEILARLLLRGAKVAELPSVLSDRRFGASKMRKLETIGAHVRLLVRLAGWRWVVVHPAGRS